MDADFKESSTYLDFDRATKALVDSLIAAQLALGPGQEDAPLPYGAPITIETRSATYEEVCPLPDTECGDNPFLTLIPRVNDSAEDNKCKAAVLTAYDDVYSIDYPTFASKWQQMCNSYKGIQTAVE